MFDSLGYSLSYITTQILRKYSNRQQNFNDFGVAILAYLVNLKLF